MGGGLGGLTLALQLKRRFGDIDVVVLERRAHPVPHAAHKVGESSVEIGAHYFDTVLGLKAHMHGAQLRKFGFRFFFSEGRRDIDQVTEIGASRYLAVPSYQIDRGIFENYLAEEATRRGVRFVDSALVRRIDLAEDPREPHRLSWTQDGETHLVQARWLIDACGRAGMLKRKLGLAEPNAHECNAVWFRIGERITIDDWSDNAEWRARCEPQARWLSTNHLVGAGYWVWLIPLASGSHSVGIVADPRLHPIETIDSFDKAMQWFRTWQPRLFDELDGKRHLLQDFAFFRDFSYGCKQVFSGQRWALTGEAGLFLDPFYSPGTDFIGIANTYICDLIGRERAGKPFGSHAEIYQQLYFSFYENTLTLYQDQYPLFGDTQVMPVKVIWDYTFYWALLAPLFFAGKLTDVSMLGRLRPKFDAARALNLAMQPLLREWGERNRAAGTVSAALHDGRLLDQYRIDWFHEMNRALNDTLDDAAFEARIADNVARMDWLANEILTRARATHPQIGDHGLDPLLVREAQRPSLSSQWYAEAAEAGFSAPVRGTLVHTITP